MCRKLGRKKLAEKGMLNNYGNPKVKIHRQWLMVGKSRAMVDPRPDFTFTIHDKMHFVPHRPLFFNYLTRLVNETTLLRDRLWCTENKNGHLNRVRDSVYKHWVKLDRYDHRARTGRRVREFTKAGYIKRTERLFKQGITIALPFATGSKLPASPTFGTFGKTVDLSDVVPPGIKPKGVAVDEKDRVLKFDSHENKPLAVGLEQTGLGMTETSSHQGRGMMRYYTPTDGSPFQLISYSSPESMDPKTDGMPGSK